MREVVALLIAMTWLAGAYAQPPKETEPGKRHGIEVDLKTYPQDQPKATLASVLKGIADKRIDYVLAHLADPKWVDERVAIYGGHFGELVKEATGKLVDDPGAARQLRRFLEEGDWQISEAATSVSLKDVKDRQLFLRKADGRWFLDNRRK